MAHAEVVLVPDAQAKQLAFLQRQIGQGVELNARAASLYQQLTGEEYVFSPPPAVQAAPVPAAYAMDLGALGPASAAASRAAKVGSAKKPKKAKKAKKSQSAAGSGGSWR